MTDALMHHTLDGGNIEIVSGQVTVSNGVWNMVYLAIMGGNEDDSGDEVDDPKQWWGNRGEVVPERQYRSRTQYVMADYPATTSNMAVLREAVEFDLGQLGSALESVSVSVRLTAPKRVRFTVEVVVDSTRYNFEFEEAWERLGS